MALFQIFINVATGKAVAGPSSATNVTLPILYCPDTPTLQVYLEQPSPGSNLAVPFTPIPTAGLTFYCYLNDGTLNGTVYTQQITWTPGSDSSGPFFNATLALNTNALETLVTAAGTNGGSCYLEFGYVQNGLQTTVFRQQVTVLPGLPSNAIAPAPPGQIPLTVQVANQMYVPQQPIAGQPIELMSKNGKILVLQAVDNPDGTASFVAAPAN
jgi:hypothetical protein